MRPRDFRALDSARAIERGHRPLSGWEAFGTVLGGATAALLGLLFVAVSIRAERISKSRELRVRSAQTMALLLTGLLASCLVTIPDQARWALGVEFLGLAVLAAGVAVALDRRAGPETGNTIAHSLDATNPTTVTCVLLLVVGVVLVLGHSWGLYVLVPALFAVLIGCVTNAWLILVRLSDSG
jgi:hypothetical protein